MALIGALVAGIGVLSNAPFIQNTQYNKLTLFGQGTFDKLMVYDYAMSVEELDNLQPINHAWNPDVVFYAEFNGNLQGGSLQIPSGAVTSWNVYRYACDSMYPDKSFLGIDGSKNSLVDYTAVKHKDYYYTITPIMSSAVVSSLQTNTVAPCYEYWVLLDDLTGEYLILDLNLESGDMSQNTSTTPYIGFAPKPMISQSNLNYMSMTIQAYLGHIENNQYIETPDDYTFVKQFVNSKHGKWLKDRAGNIWRVYTTEMSAKTQDVIGLQPHTVSINITEIDV